MLSCLSLPTLIVAATLHSSPQDDLFLEVGDASLLLRHRQNEIRAEDAELMHGNFREVRNAFRDVLQLTPVPDSFTVTVRLRPNLKHFFYTNGTDHLFVDFQDQNQFLPTAERDLRIWEIARKAFAQLWVSRMLTSQAGLDPNIARSVEEYFQYLILRNGVHGIATDEPPTGPGLLWLQLDQLYGEGVSSWILTSLASQRCEGSELASVIRELAIDATEDQGAAELVDGYFQTRRLYSPDRVEASGVLAPESLLRKSSRALFHGVRLLGVQTDPLAAADRVRDFDSAFLVVTHSYPDRAIAAPFHPRLNGIDLWDIYAEFRPRVEQAQDNLDFYLILREFFARFGDRWLCLINEQGAPLWRGVQGMSLAAIDGRPFVASVRDGGAPEQAGVRPGMELLTIEGQAAADRLATLESLFATTYSCSSPQESKARALNMLLTGPEDAELELKLRAVADGDGPAAELITKLRCMPPGAGAEADEQEPGEAEGSAPVAPAMPELAFREKRDDGITVVRFDVLAATAVTSLATWLAEAEQARQAGDESFRGVVLDMRGCGAGLTRDAAGSLGLLLEREVTLGEMAIRVPNEQPGSVSTSPITVAPMAAVTRYQGPCALLVDAWTAGPAELFALGFKSAARGPVVGTATAGAGNLPPQQRFPFQTLDASQVDFSFTQTVILLRDGRALQGRGISPTIEVLPTIRGLAQETDEAMEAAIAAMLEN